MANRKTPEHDAMSSLPHHTATSNHDVQQESAVTAADSWGAADDTWGASEDVWGGPKMDDGHIINGKDAFDFSDLDTALTNALEHAPNKSYKQHDRDTSQSVPKQHASSCCLDSDVAHYLPGFYLHMTAEAFGVSATLSAGDQHIAELVAAYQDETQQVQTTFKIAR